MKSFKIFFPLALLCFAVNVQKSRAQIVDTLSISLAESVESAVTGNPDILITRLEIDRALSQLRAANGAFWPTINVDGQYVRNIKRPVFFLPPGEGFGGQEGGEQGTVIEAGFDNSFNATAQATLPLYNQALIASSRTARRAMELQEKGLDVNKNELRAEVKRAYYDALLARESLAVLNRSLENAQRNYENIRNLFSQELVPEYDVIRAEVQVENLRPEILQGQNNFEAALYSIKLLTDIPQEIPLSLEDSLEEFYEQANFLGLEQYSVDENPVIQQLEIQQDLREAQIKLQQANLYPTLSAFGNYAYQAQANDFDFDDYFWVNTSSVGLQVNIPVFQGLTRIRQIEQARIDLEQTRIQKEFQQKSLNIQAQNALNRLQRAQRSLQAQQRNIEQAERGYEIAQVSYNSGIGTLIEVNDAELALIQARLNELEVIHEFLNALADFDQLTGNENNNQ